MKADYVLHTEVVYALQASGVTQELLVFRDQVNLTDLHESHRLVLTLVDHNAMSPEERSLEGAVCEVIDHHTRVKEFPPRYKVLRSLAVTVWNIYICMDSYKLLECCMIFCL